MAVTSISQALSAIPGDLGWKRILSDLFGSIRSGTRRYTATLSPAIVAANTTAEQLFTVTGVKTSDMVVVNKPTAQAGLGIVGIRVSAANQVGITFSNNTAAGITPTASEVYSFFAFTSTELAS